MRLAVVGAGNMGSGIAQKMAAEGFSVMLVDLSDERISRGMNAIASSLDEAVERRIVTPEHAAAILNRVRPTTRFEDLSDADLIVEAVFEELAVKRDVFAYLDRVCRADAILATNTSSFSVTELATSTRHPERVIGLHYFFHPAKNRLVEVAPGALTNRAVLARASLLQEELGKTAIACRDSFGFVVNRFFAPWLTHAVRLLEDRVASAATIDQAAKQAFGITMGPFELMNVTGLPIAVHTARTLEAAFGPVYAPPPLLRTQTEAGRQWTIHGEAAEAKFEEVADRLKAAAFFAAASLVDEGVGAIEDVDIGARVGLRWRYGPFELMNRQGVDRAAALVEDLAARWNVAPPTVLSQRRSSGQPFSFLFVRFTIADGIATLTIRRPDSMNALNENVVAQLRDALRAAIADPSVKGIVIAGAGKAFVAGADVKFFVKNIEHGTFDRILEFTRDGQNLLREIETSPKPVVARLHGPTLGGGVELALACRRIVASPKATLAFPETGIGIYPGLGGTQRTPRRVGIGIAKWLILTGATLSAGDAVELGLIDRVVPHEELDQAVAGIIDEQPSRQARPAVPARYQPVADLFTTATPRLPDADGSESAATDLYVQDALKRLSWKAPLALQRAAELIDQGMKLPLADALELEMQHVVEIFSTDDAHEGLSSIGRKRPEFKGR